MSSRAVPARWHAHPALAQVHVLAESPVWDDVRGVLHWVDIPRGNVHSGILSPNGSVELTRTVRVPGGAGALAIGSRGELLVAGTDRLFSLDLNGTLFASAEILPRGSHRRFNDGKPDPAGRFVVGTLRLDGPSTCEELMVVGHDGCVRAMDEDLTMSNGLAWTPDGETMYSVDSERRCIYVRSYEPSMGTSGQRSVAFMIERGVPDGMCIDAEGCLWIAIWGIGEVHRYRPNGELLGIVDVPAPHVSSVTFAGPNLETLVITTATEDLSDADLERFPTSGQLHYAHPGTTGTPTSQWTMVGGGVFGNGWHSL